MVKRILCFGDSNTYGYIPGGNGRRYGPDVRWTGLMSAWLKPECLIIEEGSHISKDTGGTLHALVRDFVRYKDGLIFSTEKAPRCS